MIDVAKASPFTPIFFIKIVFNMMFKIKFKNDVNTINEFLFIEVKNLTIIIPVI